MGFWDSFPTPADNMKRFVAKEGQNWADQGVRPLGGGNRGASGTWGTPGASGTWNQYEQPYWPGMGGGQPGGDDGGLQALRDLANQEAPPPPGPGGGGGGSGGGFNIDTSGMKDYKQALKDLKTKYGDLATAQRTAGDSIRDQQLMPLLGNELQYDLSPLAALVDNWTGSNMARSYKAPESAQERRREIGGLQNAIGQAGVQASGTELAALKALADGNMDIAKFGMDKGYKDATLGLDRERLGLDKERLGLEREKIGLKPTQLAPEVRAEVTTLASKNAGKTSIANQMRGYLSELQNAETEDEKIVIGRQMLKVLNSPEGADAIGAEEAKRLGGLLEFNVLPNLFEPGPTFGRDISAFEDQVIATIGAVESGVKSNRKRIGVLTGRAQRGGTPTAPQASDDAAAIAWAQDPVNRNDPRAAQILQLNGAK